LGENKKMKDTKLMLLGITIILFGTYELLLCGMEGTAMFQNRGCEITGDICNFLGLVLSLIGFFKTDKKS
jgi:hypothetical protein